MIGRKEIRRIARHRVVQQGARAKPRGTVRPCRQRLRYRLSAVDECRRLRHACDVDVARAGGTDVADRF